jgi:hypothetical protein
MDLSAHPTLEDHITDLLSSAGQLKPMPQYVCYGCPTLCFSFDELVSHFKSAGHTASLNSGRCRFYESPFRAKIS